MLIFRQILSFLYSVTSVAPCSGLAVLSTGYLWCSLWQSSSPTSVSIVGPHQPLVGLPCWTPVLSHVCSISIWVKIQGNSYTELVLWTPSSFTSCSSHCSHLSGPDPTQYCHWILDSNSLWHDFQSTPSKKTRYLWNLSGFPFSKSPSPMSSFLQCLNMVAL